MITNLLQVCTYLNIQLADSGTPAINLILQTVGEVSFQNIAA